MSAPTDDQAETLAPINPGIGLYRHRTVGKPAALKVKNLKRAQDTLGADDFHITVGNEIELCHCKADASLKQRKLMYEPNGRFLFSLEPHHAALFKTIAATNANGEQLFAVKQHLKCKFLMENPSKEIQAHGPPVSKSKVTVQLVNAFDEESAEIELVRGWTGQKAELRFRRQLIAVLTRQMRMGGDEQMGNIDGGQYDIKLAPNSDPILVAAVCICLDDLYREKPKRPSIV